jgi:diaminopimelate epimerase
MNKTTPIKFTKMHGLGNDFMVVDGVRQTFHPTPDVIRQLADRHTGIGFDQLLIVEPIADNLVKADFFYRIFNADGSEASQCGNGARCIAQFIHAQQLCDNEHMTVVTQAGLLELYLQKDGQVKVNMGVPQNRSDGIISVGNLHKVIEVSDISMAPVEESGDLDINVGFMEIKNSQYILLRVHERGVGETLGCGSGACAAVVAGRLAGKLDEHVQVVLPGGSLSINWAGAGSPILMTGPAVTVFEGTLYL